MYRKMFSVISLVLVLIVSSFGSVFADDGVFPVEPEFSVPSTSDTGEVVDETPSL